jgi:Sulfotransferase family
MWRSGSSLLYALLNKHPKVGLMYEADLILLRSVFFKSRRFCDWAQRWQFWDKAFTRHNLDPDEFARKGIGDFPTAFAAVHTEFAKRKGATIWGDKSPNYYDRLRYLAGIFPQAKFIIVWRDPLGTANSIARAAATGNHYFNR